MSASFHAFLLHMLILIIFYWLPFTDGPPMSSFLCLWFWNHVCICSDVFVPPAPPPADLTFFLLNNSCLLTLKLDALETECLDGPQIPATYFLLQCANIRHSISTAGAEALAQLLWSPEGRSWGWWVLLVASGFQYKSSSSASLHSWAIRRTGMLKIAPTTIPTLEAFRTALQRNN